MTKHSTIAIDYTPAYEQGGGIGRLVRDLVAALARYDTETAYRLFVSGVSQSTLPLSLAPNFSWKLTRISPKWLARIWQRARLPLPVELFVGQVDLYHATDFVLPPTRSATRTVVTVHDLSFVRVPDAASPRLKAYLDVVVPRSIRLADHVIADSQATKIDLMDLYATPLEKITVLLSGVDSRYNNVLGVPSMTIRNKYNIPETPYLFTIGTVQPRKNYSRVIRALKILRERGYDLCLVIAGGKGWLENEMVQTIEATGMSDYVNLIGFVDEEDLPVLYQGAECVAFPSLYEGFGFPVLEGMACGTPVITSNISSLPEVAGDAALLVNPLDVEEIAHAIQRILDDSQLKATLIQRGLEQVKHFTWEKSAKQLKQIYTHVLATT
ncbi:MAG: glycosyltransferase family 1 protein [Anaerolineae bacterium]|nr:glycosyltransferase family 1 protein [Anaerolineae bacterium]MDQ7037067.1 glycosyltransferase family 1 protein [Anaerolineae bacterium]